LKNPPKKNNDSFYDKVYAVVLLVPKGRVTSYGAIAKYIGSPGASRMVGWAMNNCHIVNPAIPAHRVVNRKGILTGKHHFRHENLMQELLENEGLVVEKDAIRNFENHFWDPSLELV
jgi:methylated-DNA-protein-cysteine methyltransferase-like protein